MSDKERAHARTKKLYAPEGHSGKHLKVRNKLTGTEQNTTPPLKDNRKMEYRLYFVNV